MADTEENFDLPKSSVVRNRLQPFLQPDEVALLYLRYGAERTQASLAQERGVHRGVLGRRLDRLLVLLRKDPILQALVSDPQRATGRP